MVSRKCQAFSLVELLVVIAILAILASLITAALGRAKERARTIECLNNKRQLGIACALYTVDNNDWMVPVSHGIGSFREGSDFFSWIGTGQSWDSRPDNTNSLLLTNTKWALLAKYMGSAWKPYKCPADNYVSAEQRRLGWKHRVRSVSMNDYMGDGQDKRLHKKRERGSYIFFKKTSYFRNFSPSEGWLIVDEHPDSLDDGEFTSIVDPIFPVSAWRSLPASLHRGAAAFVFVDGHTELKRWLVAGTKAPVLYENWSADEQNPDRRDYDWMITHTTARKDGRPVVGTPTGEVAE